MLIRNKVQLSCYHLSISHAVLENDCVSETSTVRSHKVPAVATAHPRLSHKLPLHPKVHIKKLHMNNITLHTTNDFHNLMGF